MLRQTLTTALMAEEILDSRRFFFAHSNTGAMIPYVTRVTRTRMYGFSRECPVTTAHVSPTS